MDCTASFTRVYDQSRFRSVGKESAGEKLTGMGGKPQEQHERFSVACLALVLKHEIEFRKKFLELICEYASLENSDQFEVLVEPERSADLVLRAKDQKCVFVIECKIRAPLEAHQRFGTPEFNQDEGYGKHLNTYFENGYKQVTYITLQNDSEEKSDASQKIKYLSKKWSDLNEIDTIKENPWVEDLFGALAEYNKLTKNMNMISKASDACKVEFLLDNAAEAIKAATKLKNSKGNKTTFDPSGPSFIGRAFLYKDAGVAWQNLVGANENGNEDLSWFGYEGEKRIVGFYCAKGNIEKVNVALSKACPNLGKVDQDEGYVWIESDGSELDGDQEWFVAIYKKLQEQFGAGEAK
jgi:hypothetical protein